MLIQVKRYGRLYTRQGKVGSGWSTFSRHGGDIWAT